MHYISFTGYRDELKIISDSFKQFLDWRTSMWNRIATLASIFLSFSVFAQNYEYPELMVVPSATERLMGAASQEKDGFILNNWTWIAPAVMQLATSVHLRQNIESEFITDTFERQKFEDEVETNANIGILSGAFWLGAFYYIDRMNRPYESGLKQSQKFKGKSKRDRLKRERAAEDTIYFQAKTAKRLKYLMAATSIFVAVKAADDGKETTKSLAGVTIISAALPFLFEHRWERQWRQHKYYKKRTFGPIASSKLFYERSTNKVYPGVNFSYNF
ncbi:MAG: hypothetical protein AB8E15_05875 [Bdellovibrionales bacterium]